MSELVIVVFGFNSSRLDDCYICTVIIRRVNHYCITYFACISSKLLKTSPFLKCNAAAAAAAARACHTRSECRSVLQQQRANKACRAPSEVNSKQINAPSGVTGMQMIGCRVVIVVATLLPF